MVKRIPLQKWLVGFMVLGGLCLVLLTSQAEGHPQADFVVDGLIDPLYGAPVAADSAGDGNGYAVMDLVELYVGEDADNYYFAFTITGDIGATSWGKYALYIDTTNDAAGATSDAWTRNVVVSDTHKPEFALYSWVDCPSYNASCTQFWNWTGTDWTQAGSLDEAARATGAPSVLEWRIAKSRLGDPGMIWLEAWSTGGGDNDNAQDTINDPAEDWNPPPGDWSTLATLACSTQYPSGELQLTVTSPEEGELVASSAITVTGSVSPTFGVTVTVDLNRTDLYTPSLDFDGSFNQPILLNPGPNTITVTAEYLDQFSSVVRHVSFGAAHDNEVFWDGLEHDSRDDFYRQPFGAVPTGTPVLLRFRTYANDVTEVKVRLWDTAQEAQRFLPMTLLTTIPGTPYDHDIWQVNLPAPDYLTVLYYRFIVSDGADTDYYEDDDLLDGGVGQPYDSSVDNSWQIDVHAPDLDTPDWFKNAVVYQIFPDRFRNGLTSNDPVSGTFFYDEDPGVLTAPAWNWIVPDPRVEGPWYGSYSKLFYGGDIQGIIDKLDYLQDLGVDTLYLNPIFESPSNHKYDTTDYMTIDDNLGDLATFITLTNELDNRGMHLILDGVFNHTSSDSHYFDRYGRYGDYLGACEDESSPYRDWFYFSPADPAGTGVCAGDTDYVSWWGFDSLPKLNTVDNPAVRSYIYSDTTAVATHWIDLGADGWRLDVAGDVDPSFWQDWRPHILDANPEAITLAEEWGDASRFILGDTLDSAMNYRFRNAVIGLLRETDWEDTNSFIRSLSVSQFDRVMHSLEEDYPAEAFYAMMNLVGSHDVNRVLIPLDQDGDPTDDDYTDGKRRLSVLAIIQMTMPGAPSVYYGDEVGLAGYGEPQGGGVFSSDPYNRQPYPWADEGFDLLPDWRQPDPDLLAHFSSTIGIRNAHPSLRTGSFDTLLTDDGAQVYAYGRKLENDAALVAINLGAAQTITVEVAGYLPEGTNLTDLLNANQPYTVTNGLVVLQDVPSMWGRILTVDPAQDLTPPDPPLGLEAVEGDAQVELSWAAAPGAETYAVYRSYVSGGGYAPITTGESSVIFTDTTPVNGRRYYYVITSMDSQGNQSTYSSEIEALPHPPITWAGDLHPPALEHTIGLTPTSPISAQVWVEGVTEGAGQGAGITAQLGFGITGTYTGTWEWVPMDFAGDEAPNDIYQASPTPEATGILQYLARFSTTGGREWTYAYSTDEMTGTLTVLPSTDTTAPQTPANLRVTGWAADWAALAWDPILGDPTLYAYDIFRSEVSGTLGTVIYRQLAAHTTYTDTGLSTGHTYTYTIQALDTSLNRSNLSNQVEVTAEPRLVAVTFQVEVPPYTPADATVYLVGDRPELCGWCNPQTIPMQQTGEVTWTRTLTFPDGVPIQYKYTRGNWDVNEWWGPIVSVFNRHATVDYGSDGARLLADSVPYWRDPLVISHLPLGEAVDIDPDTAISVTLSRYLDPTTITAQNLSLADGDGATALDISFTHHTEMTATTIVMTPTSPLDVDSLYTITLQTGLSGRPDDNEGVSLQRPYSWRFWTRGSTIYLPLVLHN